MQKLLLGFTLRISYFLRFSKCLYCYMYLLLPDNEVCSNHRQLTLYIFVIVKMNILYLTIHEVHVVLTGNLR